MRFNRRLVSFSTPYNGVGYFRLFKLYVEWIAPWRKGENIPCRLQSKLWPIGFGWRIHYTRYYPVSKKQWTAV